MVICLERGADLHMARLMPLPLIVSCSIKSRLVIPFWYRLTGVVPEKGPLNGCMYHLKHPVNFSKFTAVFCAVFDAVNSMHRCMDCDEYNV